MLDRVVWLLVRKLQILLQIQIFFKTWECLDLKVWLGFFSAANSIQCEMYSMPESANALQTWVVSFPSVIYTKLFKNTG